MAESTRPKRSARTSARVAENADNKRLKSESSTPNLDADSTSSPAPQAVTKANANTRTANTRNTAATTAEPQPPPALTPSPSPPPPPLPASYTSGQSLPTVTASQPSDLYNSKWQTIEESGVMAESVERSRKKWLSEGLFQRYWVKPRKGKNITAEPAENPAKESMVKAGVVTIHIEPHVFEATLFTVKDTSKQPSQTQTQPAERPTLQYGPPNVYLSNVSKTQEIPPAQAAPRPQTQPVSSPAVRSTSATITATTTASQVKPTTPHTSILPPTPTPSQPPTRPATIAPPQKPAYNQARPANVTTTPSAPPPNKSSDPVIQMLAERAATDMDLKALMRIVADGKASPEELKKFQGHIDDLTKILHQRQAAAAVLARSAAAATTTPAKATVITLQPQTQSRASSATPHQIPGQPQAQALRSRGPPPPAKQEPLSAVCFEFTGGSGDRFLFPKHSILDFHNSCRCVCSFLIVRKGSEASATHYDPAIDYYQPCTIRIEAPPTNSKLLDCLKAVVASQEDVRKYMDGIMDQATRAEYVLLAMRLPKDSNDQNGPPDKSLVEKSVKQTPLTEHNGVLWTAETRKVDAPPSFKRVLGEDEMRVNYIRSIAAE